MFELPFYRFALGFAFALVILSLMIVTAVHYIYGGLRLQPKGDRATVAAQVQLSALIAIFLLLKSVAYYLDRFGLVTKSEILVAWFHRPQIHRCLCGFSGSEHFGVRFNFGCCSLHIQYIPTSLGNTHNGSRPH